MYLTRIFAFSAAATLGLGLCPCEEAKKATKADPLGAIKKLAGDWSGTMKSGSTEKDFKVNFRVSSGGSVVIETIDPGSEHEMTTIYQRDGDNLILTHYCMLGNQPKMKAKTGGKDSKIVFDFAGGTNLDPAKDSHMHDMTMEILDADHIKESWNFQLAGKPGDLHVIEMMRK